MLGKILTLKEFKYTLFFIFVFCSPSLLFSDEVPFRTWKVDSDELQSGWLDLEEQTTSPSPPNAGVGRLYYSSDGSVYLEDSTGTSHKFVYFPVSSADVGSDLDWNNFTDTMTLDATTTIDMDTNSASLDFDTTNHTLFIDSANNRIGIGTNVPAAKLHILGTDNEIKLDYDGTNYVQMIADSSGGLKIWNNGNSAYNWIGEYIPTAGEIGAQFLINSPRACRLLLWGGSDTVSANKEWDFLVFAGGPSSDGGFYNWYIGIDTDDWWDGGRYLYIGGIQGANIWANPDDQRYFSFSLLGDFWQRLDSGAYLMGSLDDSIIDDMESVSDWSSSDTVNTIVSTTSSPVIRGQYAMQITTSAGNSNADTVTKIFSAAQDFSGVDKIAFWIRASQSGQIVSIELDDDTAATDPHHDITIEEANRWQYEVWDISSINALDRDAIGSIKFIIDNDTGSPTIYIDQLRKYNNDTRGFEIYTDTDANTTLLTNGKLVLPDSVEITSPGSFVLKGDARHLKVVRFSPEYPNAVFQADGADNSGTMDSGIEDPTTNNYLYSYYRWSTTQLTLQDYDIYMKWQVPSDFDGFPEGIDNALVVDIATATTLVTDNAVDVYLYKDGSATTLSSSVTDKTSTTAGVWMTDQENTAVIKFAGSDSVLSSLSAGDVLVIRIKLKANNTNSGWAKVGSITLRYLSKY